MEAFTLSFTMRAVCYIEGALRTAFKERYMQRKENISMLSVVCEHSFDHSIL